MEEERRKRGGRRRAEGRKSDDEHHLPQTEKKTCPVRRKTDDQTDDQTDRSSAVFKIFSYKFYFAFFWVV